MLCIKGIRRGYVLGLQCCGKISGHPYDNLLPQRSTEVLSGRLTIKSVQADWKASVNPTQRVKITVTVKDVNEIVLSAPVGNLGVNDLRTDTLKLVLSGAAHAVCGRGACGEVGSPTRYQTR